MAGRAGVKAVVALLACLVCSWVISASALAAEPPSYLGSFGPDGTTSTGFSQAGPIAVDQGDFVYVIDHSAGELLKFDLAGNPIDFIGSAGYITGNRITGLSFFAGAGESQVAVDSVSHTIYVTSGNAVRAFQQDGEPYEFTAGPGAGTSEIGGFSELLGVAVDNAGNIYTADYAGFVRIYAPSGELITQFEAATAANIAVDSKGAVYVNRWHGTVLKYVPSEFPVTSATTYLPASEPLDATTSYTVAVDPTTNYVYVAENEGFTVQIAVYDENGTLLTTFAAAGEEGELSSSEGVGVDGSSGRIYVSNAPAGGLSQVEIFGPEEIVVGAPSIESTSVGGVTASSAVLRAAINPNTFATTYRFEYGLQDCGTSSCASVPVGGASIGAGHFAVDVSEQLSGLLAGTTYHYRVVAENSSGITFGPDRTFTTQGASLGFELSDSRVWEMVSPSNKAGGAVVTNGRGIVQASTAGDALAYLTRGAIESGPEGNRAIEISSVLARREGDGWHSKDITPPHTEATGLRFGSEYKLFTPDLAKALLEPRDGTPLSPESTERAPYLRVNSEPPQYTALVNGGNVPAGTHFDEFSGGSRSPVSVSGANADLTHVILASKVPLVPGANPFSLYEWAGGVLEPVSEMPSDEGGEIVLAQLGSGRGSIRHAVSEDGSRVFWSPTEEYSAAGILLPALFVRDTVADETSRLDVVQTGGSGAGPAHPAFQGASADGSVVFFTDSQQLTADASPDGRDLYRCEIGLVGGRLGCVSLINISSPIAGSGESADVKDLVPAISDDGKRVYFIAEGRLDATANAAGDTPVADTPNLYLWEEGQKLDFIASLSSRDYADWGATETQPTGYASRLSAFASPSGRFFAFMTERSLTGYENRNASTGEPNAEVHLYDADTGGLVCVSCNPTSAQAVGQRIPTSVEAPPKAIDPQGLWEGRWTAATLPEAGEGELFGWSFYHPRAVLDNGRVFFNAVDGLVSADSNGNWDVYQYEPVGVGSCTASSGDAALVRLGPGCVGVLSSGTAEGESAFLDASSSGDDVFFLSRGRLSVLDHDDALDVYDARVNGVPAVLHPVTECVGGACQAPSALPGDPTPASEAFQARSVPVRCRKGKRKVRRHGKTRCVRKHHRHKKDRRRAGHGGRAHR